MVVDPAGVRAEASPPVPLSLTGEGGRMRRMVPVGCAVRTIIGPGAHSAPYKLPRLGFVPPLPSGRGGRAVRLRRAHRLLLLFLFLLLPPATHALEVRIVRPAPGEALLGETEVRADVLPAGAAVQRVEFILDGVPAGTAMQAPYRILLDAGDDNVEHRLEVVAYGPGSDPASASVLTPRLHTDTEIRVDLQQLFVTVENRGKPVLDLTQDDFSVLDQGTPQPFVTFGRGDVPFTAVLLV